MSHERYDPLPTIAPRNYFFGVGQGDYSQIAVTISASASDITGQHAASLDLRIDPDAPTPAVNLGYAWRGGPVDLGVSLGLGESLNRSGLLYRGVSRLVQFDVARWDQGALAVRRALAPLSEKRMRNLSYSAYCFHRSVMDQRVGNGGTQ